MSASVEVVSEAKRESMSKILFDAKVHLLGIGVNKTFALRISERLERQREESGGLQVILIGEQAHVERIKPLFVGQVSGNLRQAGSRIQNSLKNIRRIQTRSAGSCGRVAGTAAREQ